jgi:pSer/pThr/pTyr-binding forkhead associated (FHA) protein
MDAKLVVVGGEAKMSEVQLKLPTIIGRGRAAGITLPHPLVSRQHCEIYEEQGRLVVNDMGSLNGTFVGDQRINEPTFLLPGELLTVGTVTFRAAYTLANGEEAVEESTGTDYTPSDATVQFAERTMADGNKTVPVDEDLAEALPVEDAEEAEAEVEFAEAEVEEVAAVEVEEESTPDTAELNAGETSGDEDDDDLQSFLKGLG